MKRLSPTSLLQIALVHHKLSIASMGLLLVLVAPNLFAQTDSVDVTFRLTPLPTMPRPPYVVGEFNGWNTSAMPMSHVGNDVWARTVRLRIGGNPTPPQYGVPGAWQYKFYPPATGQPQWPNDSLNHHVNPNDNNNSVLFVKDPTIYHFVPNLRTGIVRTSTPVISAFLYPKVGTLVDTASIVLRVGPKTYSGIGSHYDPIERRFSFRLPEPISNGVHKVVLSAGSNIDSVSIIVQAGYVQISTRGGFTTRNPVRHIRGRVEGATSGTIRLVQNGGDTIQASVSNGFFAGRVTLREGVNTFVALATDLLGTLHRSDSVLMTYVVDHAPTAKVDFFTEGSSIRITGLQSTDPDSGQTALLQFNFSESPANPQATNVGGSFSQVVIPKPQTPGEYYYGLIVRDPDGNADTTRNYFTILSDGSFQSTTMASVPDWVRKGRVYELFFKSFTPEGTINAALPYLTYLKNLGVNILWVMPVMMNANPINNDIGPGYNIKDFYSVAPEYGTIADFKNFAAEAHKIGLKVILDVTPNHASYAHPFVSDAKVFREDSYYWNFFEHSRRTQNTNNLGDCLTADGFNYYCGFSDQLLNYDWSDIDARYYKTSVYRWWIKEMGIDGYRYDVYWGPLRRYGEQAMGIPVRSVLRRVKPDILLLAEESGVGLGTEAIYADRGGGVDAGYDWQLYWDGFRNLYSRSLEDLNSRITNFGGNTMGFVPGPNSYFLRFLENHDEDRISYLYGSYERTMPAATVLFTVPGLPMIYSGQEVGYGLGIEGSDERSLNKRRRGVIDWNVAGKSLLLAHYQKLAHIRGSFAAFSSQDFIRLSSGNSSVYTYVRPFPDNAGVVAANFSAQPVRVVLAISASTLGLHNVQSKVWYASNLYENVSTAVQFVDGRANVTIDLRPYGSAVFVFSDTVRQLQLPSLDSGLPPGGTVEVPRHFVFHQNFPNPFNPGTTFRFELETDRHVTLRIYNLIGEEIVVLLDHSRNAGIYNVEWDGRTKHGHQAASGVYFARLESDNQRLTQKIVMIR
ncbi:MAG: T9SS type A sorting domain-containing protein [Ignavibacteria bacterium]|nr:T9SS type A sorting domain-containing protein [Ignavibacteria bacterium]